MTVAPPARVESTKTLPCRSSTTNAVVASRGSILSARAAIARVVAATSTVSVGARGTKTCIPLAPLVFAAPASPASSSTCLTSRVAATASRNPSWGSTSDGGSRSRIRWVWWSGSSVVIRPGWYSTARWFASQISVRRSLASA